MAYTEGVRTFELVREYIRDFMIYGFHTRSTIGKKSTRSYDDMRRRITSWLRDAVLFRQDKEGRHVYISVDTRAIAQNPLFQAFKAKSFTDMDITLTFCLLDLLRDGPCSFEEVMTRLNLQYLNDMPDESTVRAKLRELEKEGLLVRKKEGRKYFYACMGETVDKKNWQDAVSFGSETEPCGVIGSYILDTYEEDEKLFSFKHAYFVHALENEILYQILVTAGEKKHVIMTISSRDGMVSADAQPLRIYLSTETGREYLLGWCEEEKQMRLFRLDHIHKVKAGRKDEDRHEEDLAVFEKKLWGVSIGDGSGRIYRLKLAVHVGEGEGFIVERLMREKRNGSVRKEDEETYVYETETYDPKEMIPWLRTFIGRIEALECDDEEMMERFRHDLAEMKKIYGGSDAVR
jgi:DNA-binding PadR family transcriptional regulator